MPTLITLTGLSGSGKSEVYNYVREQYPQFHVMDSYTSRAPRHEGETGYIFKDKQFFIENISDFVEYEIYPPGSTQETGNYYGKHISQFDGKNYISIFADVGMEILDKKFQKNQLNGYKLVKILIASDEKIRLARTGDVQRIERDRERNLPDNSFYDYIINNNVASKEELYQQIDTIMKQYIS